jgi:hypothetical protein
MSGHAVSRAFIKETDETFEVLPDRPISAHQNLVTPEGLELIETTLARWRRNTRWRRARTTGWPRPVSPATCAIGRPGTQPRKWFVARRMPPWSASVARLRSDAMAGAGKLTASSEKIRPSPAGGPLLRLARGAGADGEAGRRCGARGKFRSGNPRDQTFSVNVDTPRNCERSIIIALACGCLSRAT